MDCKPVFVNLVEVCILLITSVSAADQRPVERQFCVLRTYMSLTRFRLFFVMTKMHGTETSWTLSTVTGKP